MNKTEFDTVYNIDVQRLLLSHMIDDPDLFVRCQSIVKDEYFDSRLSSAVRYILSHANEHKKIPEPALIHAKTGVEIKRLAEYGVTLDENWFLDEIVQFCRYKGIENLIMEGIDLLEKNQFSIIEKRLKDALTISLVSDLGTEYFTDPEARLKRMLEARTSMIPTGWANFDRKLYGGFSRGGLNVFAGGSGSGKSLILQNYALNKALDGETVIYFTLELSEELVALRIDAMLSGKGTPEITRSISDTAFTIKMKGKNAGTLVIKKMPEGGTNTNHLRAFLKEYQIKTGKKPTCIVIDYLDLMYPNNERVDMSSLFVKDKFVSEEIRGMMHETDTFGATASQLNRQSVEAQGEFDHSHIAGGISKINTADNVIAINAPFYMKEKGEMEFIFLKTRSSNAVGQRLKMSYDPTSMRITDIKSADIETEKPMPIAELKQKMRESEPEPEVEPDVPSAPVISKFAHLMAKQRNGDMM